jgi:hypothetical protein
VHYFILATYSTNTLGLRGLESDMRALCAVNTSQPVTEFETGGIWEPVSLCEVKASKHNAPVGG